MRKAWLPAAAVAVFSLAMNTTGFAQEQAEQPEIDPAGVQPPANQQTPSQQFQGQGQTQFPTQQFQGQTDQPQYPTQQFPGQVQAQYPAQQFQAQSDQPQQQFQQQPPQYPAQQFQSQPGYGGGSPYYSQPPAYNYSYGAPGGGYTGYAQTPAYQYSGFGPPGAMLHPRVATAPAGLTIPVTLQTAISTQVAKEGDFVQASIDNNVQLQGLSYIPSGSVVSGEVTSATAGRLMNRSGSLGIAFNKLQLPSGQSIPIQAHVLGDIGKYEDKDGTYHGEGWGAKLGNFALRTGIGAGGGALFGTALGAIAGGRIGTGAWAGTAIGGGVGALDDIFLRRGKNVLIHAGTPMQIQLDAPVQIPVDIQPQYGAS